MSLKNLQHLHSPNRFPEMVQRVNRAITELDKLIQRAHQLGDDPTDSDTAIPQTPP